MIRQLDDKVMVCGQVAPHEVAGLAEQGVTMLVNNRPDGEEPGQPLAGDIEEAAAAAGIGYRFVPIMRGIGPADIEEMQKALRATEQGKLLAFCRSGTRSALARRARQARGRRFVRGSRSAAEPGRVRPRSDRPPALGLVVAQHLARFIEVFVEHHHADADHRAFGIAVAEGVEDHRLNAVALQIHATEISLERPIEPSDFDDVAHQGLSAPVAISSGREARPSIAFRCGKRPKRSMIWRWCLA